MIRILNKPICLLTQISLLICMGAAPGVAAEATEMSLGMVVLNVPDLDAAEAYYSDVIGFELVVYVRCFGGHVWC